MEQDEEEKEEEERVEMPRILSLRRVAARNGFTIVWSPAVRSPLGRVSGRLTKQFHVRAATRSDEFPLASSPPPSPSLSAPPLSRSSPASLRLFALEDSRGSH